MIRSKLSEKLRNRLGKVYIEPSMKNYTLPLAENTSQGGLGVLSKGSRISIDEGKKLRAFTYWEKVNDIDLSVFALTEDGNRREFSWRTMSRHQSGAITYSGDETSGYLGGSEYFDINLPEFKAQYSEYRYLIFAITFILGKTLMNGSYYILAEGEADWNRYLNRIEEKNWYVDFSDIQMICYKLTESGIWSHDHINPLYLEVEFPTYIEDDPKRQVLRYAMEALGDYLSHKSKGKEFCPDLVLKYARKYAEVCREKSLSEKMLEEAKKPEDIML